MTRRVAIFEDKQRDMEWIRRDHAQDRFDHLEAHRERIIIAGGLRPAPGERHCGGLWVIEAASRSEAVALCENGPYFRLGLRAAYRLCVWGKAPPDREVTL